MGMDAVAFFKIFVYDYFANTNYVEDGQSTMNFVQINYFLTVAKCLSFTKAANLLYVSQPALSRQIIMMEDELGIKLFDRNGRRLRLTPSGQILSEELETLFLQYKGAVVKAQAAATNLTTMLRIGILDGIAVDDLLTPALREMSQKYPNIEVALFSFGYEELATRLYDGRLDLIFSRKFDVEHRNEIEYRLIEKTEDYLVARAGYPLSGKRRRLTANDLRYDTLTVVTESENDMSIKSVTDWFQTGDVLPRFRNTPSYHASLQWVKAGLCVTVADRRSILPSEGLVKIPLEQFRDPSLVLAWANSNQNEARRPFEQMVMEAEINPHKDFAMYAADPDM